ncbi:iron export ABC transporter permease subunit FetB [Desulfuribacillus stibiiarsenatis]|uniref:Iron export ABC transporter permease subunit FetB n=1 Tax=Desulfuribacillus stibiiarsenatis TaxID=1390249 RepID=A0A1E5L8L1_9FIRM|nr:iron export ABC transporter permease subunit FetB [Desulfuribacillus stibiiarsenatis]OEH86283.1 iron export ABC transporter permease subunit FetB [Desulfuribacillus stibiiarsenatis]
MSSVIELQMWQLGAAYVFILILLVIVRVKGIKRETEIVLASIRMTLQLILVAYILSYMFDVNQPMLTVIFLICMQVFAIHNIFNRVKIELLKATKLVIAFSMVVGTVTSILYFNLIVIQFSPWHDPRYFIPIAGMIIGNSMTGISLGVTRLVSGFHEQREMVECSLMLGATPKMASRSIINQAFDSAILPTINSMVGMGIVFLPGMMTGQILSGISPIVAVEYQIAIMLGIVGSVTLSVILFVQLGYKTFFNQKAQLNI